MDNEKDIVEEWAALEQKYNTVCTKAMINIYSITKPEDGIIPIHNFNRKNSEHQFILSAARGLGGVVYAQVAVDINPIVRWWLNRKLPEECRLLPYRKEYNSRALEPDVLLEFMRPWAVELCGEDFNFGHIYDEFYKPEAK